MGGTEKRKRKGDKKGKDSKSGATRSRGDYTATFTTDGAGTSEDPIIIWYIPRPRKDLGQAYERAIRDAAAATGLGVWYIRSLSHDTTTIGGAYVQDDPHITCFADSHAGGDSTEDFSFDGHVYLSLYDDRTPYRLLHPEEFGLAEVRAPVVLYDGQQQAFPFYLGEEYYEYYDNAVWYEDEDLHGNVEAESSQTKERKRKGRSGTDRGKGKGKAKEKD